MLLWRSHKKFSNYEGKNFFPKSLAKIWWHVLWSGGSQQGLNKEDKMCEDFPCCGHEMGDCNGQKYGSDESIKAAVYARMDDPDYDPYYDDQDY